MDGAEIGMARWRSDRFQFAAGWSLFAWFVMWQATTAPVLIWQDSKDYEAIGSRPLWSYDFWFTSRPPLTPLLWKLTGSPEGFSIGQTLISIVSWGFLAWTVGRLFPSGWRRLTGSFVVLAFATTTPIALWDRSVLSESLALSGLALLFAVSIRIAQKPTLTRGAALVFAASWCALARDTEIILPVILGLLIVVYVLLHRRGRANRLLVLTACGLLVGAGFCIATVINSGRDALNTTDNMYVRVFPYPARVAWFATHGMPDARQIDKLAETERPVPGTAKAVFPDLSSPAYASLNNWIDDDGSSTYALWIATHPWFFFLEPLRRPERTFNNADGDINSYAATNRVTSGLTPVLWPHWIWLEGAVAALLVLSYERELPVGRVAQVVVVLGLIGLPSMLFAWNGDGQEVTRHTIEGLAEIHLGVLIAALYAVLTRRPQPGDGPFSHPTRRRPGGILLPRCRRTVSRFWYRRRKRILPNESTSQEASACFDRRLTQSSSAVAVLPRAFMSAPNVIPWREPRRDPLIR